jgi:hypothetical protein
VVSHIVDGCKVSGLFFFIGQDLAYHEDVAGRVVGQQSGRHAPFCDIVVHGRRVRQNRRHWIAATAASCPAVVLGLLLQPQGPVPGPTVSGTCSSENSINDDTLDDRIKDGMQRVLATVRHFPGRLLLAVPGVELISPSMS